MGSMSIGIFTLTEAVIGPGAAGEKGMSGTSATKAGTAAVGVGGTNMAEQEVLVFGRGWLAAAYPSDWPNWASRR